MPRAAVLALALAAACAGPAGPGPAQPPSPSPAPARIRVEDVPRELQPAVARAEAAVKTLRDQISARLSAEIAAGGVTKALAFCRRDVPALSASISAQTGVAVGRMGVRPRPGASPPRPWIAPLLEGVPARRAAEIPAVVLDLGDRVGLLRPAAVSALCLSCHGPPERVLPEVKLAADGGPASYGEGDLRGFFWAEAKK